MAKQNNRANKPIRFNFRLNADREKERIVLEFLREHTTYYDASRIIKETLYERITGVSWATGQPVYGTPPEPTKQAITSSHDQEKMLTDILDSLDDWQ